MYVTVLFNHFLKVLVAQQYVFHCSFLSFSESLGCSTVCISLFSFVIFLKVYLLNSMYFTVTFFSFSENLAAIQYVFHCSFCHFLKVCLLNSMYLTVLFVIF